MNNNLIQNSNLSPLVFFHAGPLSTWYKCRFVDDDIIDDTGGLILFTSAEQYIVVNKAILFEDDDLASDLMTISDVKTIKSMEKKVKNYDESQWLSVHEPVIYRANYLKFKQNALLQLELMRVPHCSFVNANKYDRVLGIGYGTNTALANRETWGLNILGKTLDRVRDDIINLQSDILYP